MSTSPLCTKEAPKDYVPYEACDCHTCFSWLRRDMHELQNLELGLRKELSEAKKTIKGLVELIEQAREEGEQLSNELDDCAMDSNEDGYDTLFELAERAINCLESLKDQ